MTPQNKVKAALEAIELTEPSNAAFIRDENYKTIRQCLKIVDALLQEGEGLEDCPFCGGEVDYIDNHEGRFIVCVSCGLTTGGLGSDSKEKVIKAWNTRHSPARALINEFKGDE
ncbi:MAG: Lar family restriction alleviation protein [Candidatus Anammoxibacter sp.]